MNDHCKPMEVTGTYLVRRALYIGDLRKRPFYYYGILTYLDF